MSSMIIQCLRLKLLKLESPKDPFWGLCSFLSISMICIKYPKTQTRLDIPRPLITQSHRHGWTYQGLWLPSHTDTAGHTKAFDYPVTQTRLGIPRPLITQSHRHGWTYQGLRLPSHGARGGAKCSVPWVGLEPTMHRFTFQLATHWAIPAPPGRYNNTTIDQHWATILELIKMVLRF